MKIIKKLKRTLKEYRRVISIARKPSGSEFTAILKVSGLGIVFMGLIGFAIQLLYQYIIRAVM